MAAAGVIAGIAVLGGILGATAQGAEDAATRKEIEHDRGILDLEMTALEDDVGDVTRRQDLAEQTLEFNRAQDTEAVQMEARQGTQATYLEQRGSEQAALARGMDILTSKEQTTGAVSAKLGTSGVRKSGSASALLENVEAEFDRELQRSQKDLAEQLTGYQATRDQIAEKLAQTQERIEGGFELAMEDVGEQYGGYMEQLNLEIEKGKREQTWMDDQMAELNKSGRDALAFLGGAFRWGAAAAGFF